MVIESNSIGRLKMPWDNAFTRLVHNKFAFFVQIYCLKCSFKNAVKYAHGDRRGPDRMVVGSITTYVISAYTTNTMSLNPARARRTRYNIM